MKTIKLIIALLFISTFSFAQDIETIEISEEGEPQKIPFAIIERVPTHADCSETLSNAALKDCMNKAVNKHVARKFNIDLSNSLNLTGKIRIFATFNINKEGNVDNIRVRAPHPKLEEEAKRVINLIPKFKKPGMQKGKPVSVAFALPIVYTVVSEPTTVVPKKTLTKKEQKALDKAAKKFAKKLEKELKKVKKAARKKMKQQE